MIVRSDFRGKAVLNALIDLPFALSPVVVGLALFLVYAPHRLVGGWLGDHGIQIIFALPGMVLATIFVSLPFVVREVVPVLREIGTEQEEAAWTLGASRSRRSGGHPAGHPLGRRPTASCSRRRAASASSAPCRWSPGTSIGRTQTLTLHVKNRFQAFDLTGAYTASVVLAVLALMTLFLMNLFRKERPRVDSGPAGDQALR